jgi:polygalacturonase
MLRSSPLQLRSAPAPTVATAVVILLNLSSSSNASLETTTHHQLLSTRNEAGGSGDAAAAVSIPWEAAARLGDCMVSAYGAKCDNVTDDTAALQAAIDNCAPQRRRVVIGSGLFCLSQPLTLRSYTVLAVAAGATLKAGPQKWLGTPFLYAANATDISIVGNGTIDGSGALWWLPHGQPGRPHLIRTDSVDNVLLQNLTLLNAANHFTNLHGSHYRIYGVTMRSPPSHIAPNTDGVNTKCTDVHVRGCDITNGDDSVPPRAITITIRTVD